MEFACDGFLVGFDEYQARNEKGEMVSKYKYYFLIGDVSSDKSAFLSDPLLQTFISDVKLLKGDEVFMSKVKVRVKIVSSMEKDGSGRYRPVQKPVYALLDQNKVR